MKTLLTIALLSLSFMAQAAGLKLENIAEIEVREVNKDGKEIIKRVPAEKVIPGTQVIYTLVAKNQADQPLNNVVISDEIPEHMEYVNGSAKGITNPAQTQIVFSVDGGKNYAAADKLTVKDAETGKQRSARASDYTHVRWVMAYPIPVGKQGEVSFRALLK